IRRFGGAASTFWSRAGASSKNTAPRRRPWRWRKPDDPKAKQVDAGVHRHRKRGPFDRRVRARPVALGGWTQVAHPARRVSLRDGARARARLHGGGARTFHLFDLLIVTPALAQLLACPACGGDLRFSPGALSCVRCRADYETKRGVARL